MNAILRVVVDVALPDGPGETDAPKGLTPLVLDTILNLNHRQIPRLGDRVVLQNDQVALIPYVKEVYWMFPDFVRGAYEAYPVILLGLNRPIISIEEQLLRSCFEIATGIPGFFLEKST